MSKKVLLIEPEEDVMIGAIEVFKINNISCDGYAKIEDLPQNVSIADIYDVIITSEISHIGRYRQLRYVKKPYTASDLLNTLEQL